MFTASGNEFLVDMSNPMTDHCSLGLPLPVCLLVQLLLMKLGFLHIVFLLFTHLLLLRNLRELK